MKDEAEIKITQKDMATTVVVDGVDISHQILAVDVSFNVGDDPVVTMHYACIVEIEGVFDVQHMCPLGDDADE